MEEHTCRQVSRAEIPMPSRWRQRLHALLAELYFEDIALRHSERLPEVGPILFLGIHRNGALDGLVYNAVVPASIYMMSKQLSGNAIGRTLFCGIEVIREKDRARFPGSRQVNREAMAQCHAALKSGQNLFVFPEGTSSLGPQRLPLQSGAAHLINGLLAEQCAINVVPVGITYDAPDQFRSNVEVIVGHRLELRIDPAMSSRERLAVIKRRMAFGMDEVGINVESQQRLDEIQHFAERRAAGSYHAELKRLEGGGRPQSTPPQPQSLHLQFAQFLILLPVVIAATLLNLPPLLAAHLAGKKLADDRNVVSLFRVMVGFPAFVVWVPAASAISAFVLNWAGVAIYAVLSLVGLCCWNRLRTTARVLDGVVHGRSVTQPQTS